MKEKIREEDKRQRHIFGKSNKSGFAVILSLSQYFMVKVALEVAYISYNNNGYEQILMNNWMATEFYFIALFWIRIRGS